MRKYWVFYSTEMWEKFMFFGMRAILPLFMVHALKFDEQTSALYYGAYLALSYFFPIIGGVIADRLIGQRRAIIAGAILFCISQLLLFFAASMLNNIQTAKISTIAALLFIIIANGFFKPNIVASLTASIDEKSKMDAIFSTYYLFINIGALLGQIIVPILGDSVNNGVRDIYAFKWGFLASTFAMLIGVVIYAKFSKPDPDNIIKVNQKEPIDLKNLTKASLVFAAGFAFFVFIAKDSNFIEHFLYPAIYALGISFASYIAFDKKLSKQELKDIFTIFISAIFITFFWAAAEQAGTSLTFIADNQTDRTFFGIDVPPSMIQMANPLFLILVALPFAKLWNYLSLKNLEPNSLNKQAIGMAFMALSFLIIAFNVKDLGNSLLALKWLLLLYFIQVIAEMLISPIGLSLVGKHAPNRSRGQLYGIFYLANAAGYALSGTLAALIPPTADKFIKAKQLGINLQDILNGVNLNQDIIIKLQENSLPVKYPSIFGINITNLYEFFMLFFIICTVASILLFIINKFFKLEK